MSPINISDNNEVQILEKNNLNILLKKKLNELQEMGLKYNISSNIQGSTKKKTKLQLAQELINYI